MLSPRKGRTRSHATPTACCIWTGRDWRLACAKHVRRRADGADPQLCLGPDAHANPGPAQARLASQASDRRLDAEYNTHTPHRPTPLTMRLTASAALKPAVWIATPIDAGALRIATSHTARYTAIPRARSRGDSASPITIVGSGFTKHAKP